MRDNVNFVSSPDIADNVVNSLDNDDSVVEPLVSAGGLSTIAGSVDADAGCDGDGFAFAFRLGSGVGSASLFFCFRH